MLPPPPLLLLLLLYKMYSWLFVSFLVFQWYYLLGTFPSFEV